PLVDQWAQVAINSYPKPIASHSQVSHDSNLFLRALQALHAHFNKKLREVTERGGYEQVVTNKQW
ncbi:ARID domain-containing protein, partial [Haematococcus lacustris]